MQGIKRALQQASKHLFDLEVEAEITFPDAKFGDYATNLALHLAKKVGKSPLETARLLADETASLAKDSLEQITVAAPGFINIKMNDHHWLEAIKNIDKHYGRSDAGMGRKVQIEFISANPTGPLTLANGRGGYSGDVLANVLNSTGHKAQREYYINDAGNQIKQLVKSVQMSKSLKVGDPQDEQKPGYSGEYIGKVASELKHTLETAGEPQIEKAVVKFVLDHYIRGAVAKMGIKFDTWFSERDNLYENGASAIRGVLEKLEKHGFVEEKEGAKWLKGDDKNSRERVLVKSDGSYTYLLSDLAYHWDKFAVRGFDRVINLWGADHAGQVQSLKDGVRALGIDKELDIIIFQLVRLVKDGKELKMSKRAGTYVAIDYLLEEIDPDVIRWFFLARDFNTHMDFDLNLAKEDSQKNPFYYVMYAYIRATAILRQASAKKLKVGTTISRLTPIERELARQMSKFPGLLISISASSEVHRLTFYGLDLASAFHDYYEQGRIIDMEPEEAGEKLFLLTKFVAVLDSYWQILGIKPRSKM
jgi:arginyl-tRNA synthetase